MQNTARYILAAAAILLLNISAMAAGKQKGGTAPSTIMYEKGVSYIIGKVRKLGKEGESATINKTPVVIDQETTYYMVGQVRVSALAKDNSILVYGKPGNTMKTTKGLRGNMSAQSVVTGFGGNFINMTPTQKAVAEARKEAIQRRTREKQVLGWYRGVVENIDPLIIKVKNVSQRVQISKSTGILTITEGAPEDLKKRTYVIAILGESTEDEAAGENDQEDETKKKKRSRRSRRSRRKKKEPDAIAKTFFIAKNQNLLEFLMDPPQPVLKKTNTSTSNKDDDENNRSRDSARQRSTRDGQRSRR